MFLLFEQVCCHSGSRNFEKVNGALPALAREGQWCSNMSLEMPGVRIPVSKRERYLKVGSVKPSQLTMHEADNGESPR
jgi:hypothetical protein